MAASSARCCLYNGKMMNGRSGITFVSSIYAANEAAAHRRKIAEAKESRREDTLPRRAMLSRS